MSIPNAILRWRVRTPFYYGWLILGTAALGSKDALALMTLWGVGNFMIIYLAAVGNVPRGLYEAAELDGADRWRKFWNRARSS